MSSIWVQFICVIPVLFWACRGNTETNTRLSAEGESCVETTDCEDGLICRDLECATQGDNLDDSDTGTDNDTGTDSDIGAYCNAEDICDRLITECQDDKFTMDDCLKSFFDPSISAWCADGNGYSNCNCNCLSETECTAFLDCSVMCFKTHCDGNKP